MLIAKLSVYFFVVFIGADEMPHFHEGMDPVLQSSVAECEPKIKEFIGYLTEMQVPEDGKVGCFYANDLQEAKEEILVYYSPTF